MVQKLNVISMLRFADCASVAALAALAHFKRPDVTTSGDEITVHTHTERDPIPIVLHHYPVCVSYAIYENGDIAIADPSLIEERRSEATVVFGLNSYRELCGLHFWRHHVGQFRIIDQVCEPRGQTSEKYRQTNQSGA